MCYKLIDSINKPNKSSNSEKIIHNYLSSMFFSVFLLVKKKREFKNHNYSQKSFYFFAKFAKESERYVYELKISRLKSVLISI